jgi:hypothetical protein
MIGPARRRQSPAAAVPEHPDGAPPFAARLVPLERGLYAVSLAAETPWSDPLAGLAVPAIHLAAPPLAEKVEITGEDGRAAAWLGGRHKMLFVKSPDGGALLVTAYLGRDPAGTPLQVEIRRVDPDGAGGLLQLPMGGPAAVAAPVVPVEIIAHIRGRGDVRFVDAEWAGRLGPGLWIEAFAIVPHDRAIAAAIEYKGLIAGGSETAWLDGGAICGTRGRGIPLLGFAVRQKTAAGGALFDCEYEGHFRSGATAGPARNGAPCRSPSDNDPLEGMRLAITPRKPALAAGG